MSIPELMTLRPKDQTLGEIEAALARAHFAARQAKIEIDDLTISHDRVLLRGSAVDLENSRKQLAARVEFARQVEAMIPLLQAELKTAQRDEATRAVMAAVAANDVAVDRFDSAWQDYPEHAEKIKGMMLLLEHAGKAASAVTLAVKRAKDAGVEDSAFPAHKVPLASLGKGHPIRNLSLLVRLPGPLGEPFSSLPGEGYWMTQEHRLEIAMAR